MYSTTLIVAAFLTLLAAIVGDALTQMGIPHLWLLPVAVIVLGMVIFTLTPYTGKFKDAILLILMMAFGGDLLLFMLFPQLGNYNLLIGIPVIAGLIGFTILLGDFYIRWQNTVVLNKLAAQGTKIIR